MSALCVTTFLAGNERNLLIALPKNIGSPKINIHEIDDFINNNFLLTYEIHYSEKVNLTHSEFPVIITGTTSGYPQIMKYVMVEGSFFQTAAWTGKLRQAVLNEKAAFILFGSSKITGNRFRTHNDTWLVTGVIRDNNDDCRIYIPSSVRGAETNAFEMTVSGSFDETYIKNSLKSIGVREGDFDFINFNAHFKRLWERIIVLLLIFAVILLLAAFRHLLTKIKNAWKTIKSELSVSYPAEILQKKRKFLFKNMVPVLGIAVIPVLSLIILISVISICLPWQDIASVNKLNVSVFYYQLNRIYTLDMISRIFFIFSLVLMCVILICARKSNTAYEAGLPRSC
jgi:hypothetical protein